MRSATHPSPLVGRERELGVLGASLDALQRHEGSLLWVEGEPGVGKTALVADLADRARAAGTAVYWATADQLSQQLPLRVAFDCLGVSPSSPDPRRAAIATFVRDHRPGLLAMDDGVNAAIEMLLALVDELCSTAPTILVIDDLQWSDDASLLVWHRLSLVVDQLPLLVIGICHRAPRRRIVRQLRRGVRSRDGTVLRVDPLCETDARALVATLLDGLPDDLLPLVSGAMGNPLYLHELVRAVGQERRTAPGGAVDATATVVEVTGPDVPGPFVANLTDRLSYLASGTVEMLRTATLFGGAFAASDLAEVLHRPVPEIAADLQESLDAGILSDVGPVLAFRHPLIRQALYESMPAALRSAMHLEAARSLADARAEPLIVAQHLVTAGRPGGAWTRRWLVEVAPALAARAPELAVELVQGELRDPHLTDGDREFLSVTLTGTLLGLGRYGQAAAQARRTLAATVDPATRAQTRWLLARASAAMGEDDEAIRTLGAALEQADLPGVWRARLLASLALLGRSATGNVHDAATMAERALRVAEAAADRFAIGYALAALWLTDSLDRDHVRALERVDRALAVLGEGGQHDDLRAFILDCRTFTLQNLSRWSEAEESVAAARRPAAGNGPGGTGPNVTAAVLRFWRGRWDDALAELAPVDDDPVEITYAGLRERGPALLYHGVSALISARRGDRASAERSLRVGGALPRSSPAERENGDFLDAARSVLAEQDGDPARALAILSAATTRRPGEMTLTHQWLPDLVRLALTVDDRRTARAGVRACRAEAEAEPVPTRAAAAHQRCLGLVERDPGALRAAVEHYRGVGAPVELAGTLEDLAEVLAEHGEVGAARAALNEATAGYDTLGARWDVRRAERRLRVLGVRRGVKGPRPPRATFGWDALTETELQVASRVALGQSTPRIAGGMLVSRRTVQTHISHILTKLGARSRMEIAREALRRGIVPVDG